MVRKTICSNSTPGALFRYPFFLSELDAIKVTKRAKKSPDYHKICMGIQTSKNVYKKPPDCGAQSEGRSCKTGAINCTKKTDNFRPQIV